MRNKAPHFSQAEAAEEQRAVDGAAAARRKRRDRLPDKAPRQSERLWLGNDRPAKDAEAGVAQGG